MVSTSPVINKSQKPERIKSSPIVRTDKKPAYELLLSDMHESLQRKVKTLHQTAGTTSGVMTSSKFFLFIKNANILGKQLSNGKVEIIFQKHANTVLPTSPRARDVAMTRGRRVAHLTLEGFFQCLLDIALLLRPRMSCKEAVELLILHLHALHTSKTNAEKRTPAHEPKQQRQIEQHTSPIVTERKPPHFVPALIVDTSASTVENITLPVTKTGTAETSTFPPVLKQSSLLNQLDELRNLMEAEDW